MSMSKQVLARRNWLFSVTHDNFVPIINQQIFGVYNENIAQRIGKGDRLVLYVVGSGAFQGIFEVVGDWHPGATFPFEVKIQSIVTGSVGLLSVKDALSFVRMKNNVGLYLQGTPANHRHPISDEDFEI